MALRLSVVSDHRRLLGDRSSIVLDASGATIGRSSSNDWVLPDPLRYVSSRHARIACRDGQYYLEDLSTNGVYVNEDDQPLGKDVARQLRSGDVLRVGEYQLVVAVEEEPPATLAGELPEHQQTATAVPSSMGELRALGRAKQPDLDSALNLDELLVPDAAVLNGVLPVNAYGQAVPAATSAGADTSPGLDEAAIARRIARLAKAAERSTKNRASVPALFDVQSGLIAFCRGAGIDSERLPADAQTRLMHLAGQLLRESLVGLKDLERARAEIRNRFRIEMPVDAEDTRPSLAGSAIEELLLNLFSQHESRQTDAVQWLRESVDGVKAHENATVLALRAAFTEFVDRLDPAELEARFERASRRGKLRSNGRAGYWDLYAGFYRGLIEMPADHLPHTFVEAFAKAYKDALQKPAP
ncbi:MAG TPA: type VI secretion system-associated FHA domain protein TagH [Steroidobacteraceae bacterium]